MRLGEEEPVRPGEVVHGYRIDRKLGAGGFAQVYLAWQGESPYALKFVRLKDAEDWAKRELTILLHLQHPHVVKLVGHVKGPAQTPGYLVLVMEYVRGRTLYDWATEENPSAREVARMVLALCRALATIHAAGVLHRDFKGDNVLVRDANGEPVLVDFGVSAVPWAPRVTRDGMAPCTPAYRSPEYVRFIVDTERPRDAPYPHARADDLFALGVTFYVLLTGAYPFWGRDEWDLMREIAQEEPRAPHERNRRVPQALGELCLRLLEKEPRARLASAGAVGDALEALLAEADASWDTPLCYGWDAAGRTTRPEPALQVPGEPPRVNFHHRRGPKPPSAEAPPKRPRRTVARGKPLRVGAACGALLASLGSGYLLLAREPPPDTEPAATPAPAGPILASLLRATFPQEGRTSEACFVREVAPPWMPPEAGAGAAPERADTPAPVVEVTAHRKGETRLKKKEHKAPEKKGIGSNLARWCVGATAAANAACAGSAAQVRPMPASQACPAEVIEVMLSRFHIGIGAESSSLFLPVFDPRSGKREPLPVQEGPTRVEILAPWARLPEGTFLLGRLVFGPERVYGRFTEALLPDGESVPVCFALVPTSGRQQGLPIEGTVEPGIVKVFPLGRVIAVERFE